MHSAKNEIYPVFRNPTLLKRGYSGSNNQYILRDTQHFRDWLTNKSMFDLLCLIDGTKQVGQIIRLIQAEYAAESHSTIHDRCTGAVAKLISMDICRVYESPHEFKPRIFGREFEFPLDSLSVTLTTQCNFRCRYCYVEPTNPDLLSEDDYSRLINEAVENLGVLNICLTGGEPLLVRDLSHRVRHASEKGCKITLLTNGFLLSQEKLRVLRDAGLHGVAVSFDAHTPELFDDITAIRGSYETVLKNVRTARSLGMEVGINTVLLRGCNDGDSHIVGLCKLFSDLGIDDIAYTTVFPFAAAKNCADLMVSPEAMMQLGRKMREVSRNVTKLDPASDITFGKNLRESDLRVISSQTHSCDLGKSMLCILPDARVTPCPSLPSLVLGNFLQKSLTEIWTKSRQLKELRDRVLSPMPNCVHCHHSEYCNRGCRARAYYDTGRIDAEDRWACAIFNHAE